MKNVFSLQLIILFFINSCCEPLCVWQDYIDFCFLTLFISDIYLIICVTHKELYDHEKKIGLKKYALKFYSELQSWAYCAHFKFNFHFYWMNQINIENWLLKIHVCSFQYLFMKMKYKYLKLNADTAENYSE